AERLAGYETVSRPAGSTGDIICIDPGHQSRGNNGKEPEGPGSHTMKTKVAGGTGGVVSGVPEYQLTLTIGMMLKTELQNRGYTVVMTRESNDVDISNKERADIATAAGAAATIRIHADGVDSASASGASVLVPGSSNPYIPELAGSSSQLGSCIINSYCAATGMKNRGVVGSDNMTGINWSTNPVALLELGFMTNPTDDANMQDDTYQQLMVRGIADGIDAYFGR
ncbi:MAG: N-acetylmuramoyl-L-alanine amidase family protein, partial [Lachnospira sp.]